MKQHYEVIVIGGGVVGLTAALAAAQRGFATALIDAGNFTKNDKPDLRVYAINHASQALWQQLGVWPLLDKHRISPYQRMHVWDAANGAAIDFDARMNARDKLGLIIEETVIKNALLEAINQHDHISLLPQQHITDIDQQQDYIAVASGEKTVQGQLVIIADGANSTARQLLQVPLTSWPYHQQALIAAVKVEKPHQQTAFQVFNADGPLAFLPLVDPNHCSIVWSTIPDKVQRLLGLPEEEFNHEVSAAFAHHLGNVQLQSERRSFPLTMRHVQQYSGKRWLLMGDAAHTIHPLAGLGLNIGLADVATWLHFLGDNKNPALPKALSAYQRQRKHAVWQSILLMEALKTCFANPFPPFVQLRGLGLKACNQSPLLKRLFISHAAG